MIIRTWCQIQYYDVKIFQVRVFFFFSNLITTFLFYFDTYENNVVFFQCKMTKDGYKIYDLRPSVSTSIFKYSKQDIGPERQKNAFLEDASRKLIRGFSENRRKGAIYYFQININMYCYITFDPIHHQTV